MSFSKAADLLHLADMASDRFDGVCLQDVTDEFGCDHRTAQRMMRALEATFPQLEIHDDEERRRRWRLPSQDPRWLQARGVRDSELTAIEMAVRRAERDGAPDEAKRLRVLRDRLLAFMPSSFARRAEADAEALLESQGFASRPGPRVQVDLTLLDTIAEALRAPWRLRISYRGAQDERPRSREIEPYGVLLGTRRYLVTQLVGTDPVMRRFRMDRIETATIMGESFARTEDFDLQKFSAQSFGSFHDEGEFGDVVWRFTKQAAETARNFIFHPGQEVQVEEDGRLIVRFRASGYLEMAWHLYQWGDQVEVLQPADLAATVARYRRDDFPALP